MKAHSVSLKISASSIAYAVFEKQKLIFWKVHHYLGEPGTIERRIVSEAVRTIGECGATAAVLEPLSETDAKTERLGIMIRERLRDLAISIFEFREDDLFEAFALPAIKHRSELREILVSIFPQLQSSRLMRQCLDAAAMGLYFETIQLLFV